MQKTINITFAIAFGLIPILGTAAVGLAIYACLPNPSGVALIGGLGLLGSWMGLNIFRRASSLGPLEYIAAAPEKHFPAATHGSKTEKRKPKRWAALINNRAQLLVGGSLRIFGDWYGRPNQHFHALEHAHYDKAKKLLTLTFLDGQRLEILRPKHIVENAGFLRIQRAERIRLSWLENGETSYLIYEKAGRKIHTESFSSDHRFDVSPSEPALMILS